MATKSSKKRDLKLSQGAMWAICAAALVGGILIGRFALVGVGGSGRSIGSGGTSLVGVTAVTEDQLDNAIGSYTYNGRTYSISIRDVIQMTSTLEAAANEDGTWQLPAADNVVTYARNKVLLQAAEDAGITVSDEELSAYALEQLGSDDFAVLAAQYNLDEEYLKDTIRDNVLSQKYREEVAGIEIPTAPIAPPEPTVGEEEAPTAEYAAYIIDLAGDAWDAENNTWADPDSEYAAALGNYEITNDSATYEAAQAAYYLAYQAYSIEAQSVSQLWLTFYNEIFSHASVTVNTLAS